jgi:hypothetical protein
MTRLQLEHIIRAASAIANESDIVVMDQAAGADVFALRHPERSDLIDGSIGEGSPFQNTFGYFAHGVDLAIAKYVAGREKDLDYTAALARHGMVERRILTERLAQTEVGPELRDIIRARIERHFA